MVLPRAGGPVGIGLAADGGHAAQEGMAAVPDFGSRTTAQKQAMLDAAWVEYNRRMGIGSVQTGASTGQSFGMTKIPWDALVATIDSLSQELGYAQPVIQAQPNFAGRSGHACPTN